MLRTIRAPVRRDESRSEPLEPFFVGRASRKTKDDQKRQYDERKADQLVWNQLFLDEFRETKSVETKQVKDELQEVKQAHRETKSETKQVKDEL